VDDEKTFMLRKHKMTDLGEIPVILGCKVVYDGVSGDYSLNQRMSLTCVRSFYR